MSSTAKGKSSSRPRSKSEPRLLRGQRRLILAICAVYLAAWFAYLGQVPAGQYPSEPERQTLDTALAIATGQAPAGLAVPAYTSLLAVAARLFDSPESLTLFARVLNALALVLTTSLCAAAAGRYWKRNRALWIAGLLNGLNPVLVFWSAQIAPTLLATSLATLAFLQALRWLREPSPGRSASVALLLLATLAFQTGALILALLWPLLVWVYPNRQRAAQLAAAILPLLAAFALFRLSSLQLPSAIDTELSALGSGIYGFFNNHEAFDGKSYGLHKRIHLPLFINPIHWGLLLVLATCGCYLRLKRGFHGHSVLFFLLAMSALATAYALLGGASQMRTLVYPAMAFFAAGVVYLPAVWRKAGKRTRRKIILGGLLLAALVYSDLYQAQDKKYWEADYAYLAEANLALRQNAKAAEWAGKALEIDPGRADMHGILTQARFNQWALGPNPQALTVEDTRELLAASNQAPAHDPEVQAIRAVYLFKLRETEQAVATWERLREQSALAATCLYWTGNIEKPNRPRTAAYSKSPYADLLLSAVSIDRNTAAYTENQELLDNLSAFAY